MDHLVNTARDAGAFVVVLGVLVFVHEMGHYLAARWRGVYVEAFSIGFGPAICSWRDRVGTVWKLSWIPLGGYVKLHGQERPQDASPETRAAWKPGQTFHDKPVASRAIIVAAGPIANFLLTAVLFAGLFLAMGRPVAIPVLSDVVPGGAAATAGLQAGDRVQAIDGTRIERFDQLQAIVSTSPGRTLKMDIVRGGSLQTLPVVIATRPGAGTPTGMLGVRGGAVEYLPVNPLQAVTGGVEQTWAVTVATVQGLVQIFTGHGPMDGVSGPLGIARLSGQVAQLGVASLVGFIAVLSVNLGLINLFPIPVLDGGYLLFYLVEALRGGRPVPPRLQEYGFRAGFALLAALFVFATWNDITR